MPDPSDTPIEELSEEMTQEEQDALLASLEPMPEEQEEAMQEGYKMQRETLGSVDDDPEKFK